MLILIFTLTAVNRIVRRHGELRWNDIKNTTLKGLNDKVRSARDILRLALFGRPPFEVGKLTEILRLATAPSRKTPAPVSMG